MQLVVWSTRGSEIGVVVGNQVYYAESPHSEAMVRLTEEEENINRREGLADVFYQGNCCHLSSISISSLLQI